MKKNYTRDEVITIINKVKADMIKSAYTYEKGCSDGYECWDITEIGFNDLKVEAFL